jgi:hypothetical protein
MAATNLERNVCTQIILGEETCTLLMTINKENVINNHRYLWQMFTYRLHTIKPKCYARLQQPTTPSISQILNYSSIRVPRSITMRRD